MLRARTGAVATLACLLATSAACTQDVTAPPTAPTSGSPSSAAPSAAPTVASTPRFGTSLSPLSSSAEDFTTFLDMVEGAGGVLLWAGEWSELATEEGAPAVTMQLADDRDFTPILATGYPRTGDVERDLDTARRDAVVEVFTDFVRVHTVPWLAVGVEVDDLARSSPDQYERYREAFADIATAVKDASPATRVFPVFQLERLSGRHGGLFGGPSDAPPQWDLIAGFPDADAIGFTTYPGLVFQDPDDIPADYYTSITDHTDLPVLFTEVGWFTTDEIPGWESSDTEQQVFVERFDELLAGMDPEAVVWSFLYDQSIQVPFDTMGLFDEAGAPRPAWQTWKKLAG